MLNNLETFMVSIGVYTFTGLFCRWKVSLDLYCVFTAFLQYKNDKIKTEQGMYFERRVPITARTQSNH